MTAATRDRSPMTAATVTAAAPRTDPAGPPPVLAAEGLSAGYPARPVLTGVDLAVAPGTVTALVGPNGSGKSTLLKACARLLAPAGGTVLLDGRAIATLSTREVARRVAVLPQAPAAPAGLTVRELIEQGRYPHAGPLRMLRHADHEAIAAAVAATRLTDFLDRDVDTLSGGERQRAWIAMALAQDTPTVLLDEPTTFLDIGHQLEVLELVGRLNAERGLTVVMVLHDLNQAARYAERLVVLDAGAVAADGPPWSVLTPDLVADVFRVRASIVPAPSGHPVCVFDRPLP